MLQQKTGNRKGFQIIGLVCVVALGLFTIIGSGGGGSDAPPEPITYTGLTTQAVVDTDTKALALAGGAFGAGNTGSSLTPSGAVVADGNDGGVTSFRPLSITKALKDAALQVDLSTLSGAPLVGSIQMSTGTIVGPCGGDVSYTIQFDDADPPDAVNFSGTFTFNSYCDGGVTISGGASVSGQIDLIAEEFNMLSFSFSNLSDGTSTLNGDINMDFTGAPNIDVTFDAFLKDNSSGLVFWAANYVMIVKEGADGADVGTFPDTMDVEIVSGRYYDPRYGYVDVATTADFRLLESNGYAWPVSGTLEGTGAGNTMVRLVALNVDQCQITADLDGDGAWDDFGDPPGAYDSTPIPWTSL